MKYILCFLVWQWALVQANAQQTVFGNLYDHVVEVIDNMPGNSGNQYSNLTPSQEEDWRALIQLIQEENFAQAAAQASPLQYRLLRFIDNSGPTNQEFFVLEKTSEGSNYWGTYVFKPGACRRLVIQCPHPKFDSNTGKQGIFVYQKADAYAYFLTGTHRCNHISPTACSGTTSVCGSSAAYRISDVAHNTLAAFHLATEVLRDADDALYFMQLHGFAQQAGDPYAIMSNGSRDTPEEDFAVAIRDGLLDVDGVLTFKIGHLDLSWNRLLAFTNTQGRYINESVDACSANASSGNGHFLHVEQEYNRLRADADKWEKMLTAVEAAMPCNATATIEPVAPERIYWWLEANKTLHFNLPEGFEYTFVWYNLLGQPLQKCQVSAQSTISLQGFGPGVFTIWSEGNRVTSGKVF